MTSEPSSIVVEKEHPEADTLSIKIEPSTSLILAIAQLFRDQKQPNKSVELCRLGLNFFPGDLGLRLGKALAYWDQNEKKQAWAEINAVSQELNRLAHTLEKIADLARQVGQNHLSEWFTLLSQLLTKYPKENFENTKSTPSLTKLSDEALKFGPDSQAFNKKISLAFEEGVKGGKNSETEALPDSNVISTLNGWLSQLKDGK